MLMHDPVRIGREVQVDGKREGGREVEGGAYHHLRSDNRRVGRVQNLSWILKLSH